jgi:hypothetical protein
MARKADTPTLPAHQPQDGNVFEWIVRTAENVRQQRRDNPQAVVAALREKLGLTQ